MNLLHPYRCQALTKEVYARKLTAAYRPVSLLASLARCMGYLVRHSFLVDGSVNNACIRVD